MLSKKEIKLLAEEIVRMQQNLEPFLTMEEAAKFLGVSVSFMQKHPEIPHVVLYTECKNGEAGRKRAIKRYQKHLLVAYMRGEE